MSESKLQSACNKWLRDRNIMYLHLQKGRGGVAQKLMQAFTTLRCHITGKEEKIRPVDIMIWHQTGDFFIELKIDNEKLTDGEAAWLRHGARAGKDGYVVKSYIEFLTVMKARGLDD